MIIRVIYLNKMHIYNKTIQSDIYISLNRVYQPLITILDLLIPQGWYNCSSLGR